MTTQAHHGTPAPQPQGTHHYVITLEVPNYASFTTHGTHTPPPGATRCDVFQAIRDHAAGSDPRMQRAVVVFFSLEPNQL